jgi:hypothetical protein
MGGVKHVTSACLSCRRRKIKVRHLIVARQLFLTFFP